ncbi:MAG: hypothetical protein H7Y38_02970 [Armatimonadetes bacterium]|nr:hypothetical protein [Armatimonadota bacterium]
MNRTGKIILGIVIAFVAIWLLGKIFAATIGYLILALFFGVIIALVVGIVRANARANADPRTALTNKADKIAERKLKDAERKISRERLKH